jgi:hypothetical protein
MDIDFMMAFLFDGFYHIFIMGDITFCQEKRVVPIIQVLICKSMRMSLVCVGCADYPRREYLIFKEQRDNCKFFILKLWKVYLFADVGSIRKARRK